MLVLWVNFLGQPRTGRVNKYAIEEARKLRHVAIGTEHLLLGVTREMDCVAAQVLMNLGLKLEEVRDEVYTFLGVGQERDTGESEKQNPYISWKLGYLSRKIDNYRDLIRDKTATGKDVGREKQELDRMYDALDYIHSQNLTRQDIEQGSLEVRVRKADSE
jgi:ATP-dependent Clp protease ATP-binding subunit ClpA